jgi:hypothetical protein
VLALLALACFPVLAQASSGTIEYDPTLPGDGGAKQNENIAKTSESPPSGGAEAPAGAGAGEGYSEEVAPSSEGGSPAGAGKDGGKGQGNPDKGNNPGAQTKVQPATPIDKSSPAASTSGDDDGGSSPLVPILIVVLVLAAISVAAVMIRQRRQRDSASPSLSTKAG